MAPTNTINVVMAATPTGIVVVAPALTILVVMAPMPSPAKQLVFRSWVAAWEPPTTERGSPKMTVNLTTETALDFPSLKQKGVNLGQMTAQIYTRKY
jgi:hypothetical protein